MLDLVCNTLHRCVKLEGFIARVSVLPLHLQVLDLLVFLNDIRVFEEDDFRSALLLRSEALNFTFALTTIITFIIFDEHGIILVR